MAESNRASLEKSTATEAPLNPPSTVETPEPPPSTEAPLNLPPIDKTSEAPLTDETPEAPLATEAPPDEPSPELLHTPRGNPVLLPPPVTIYIEPIPVEGDSIGAPVAGALRGVPADFKGEALKAHNTHRDNHKTPGLKWNATLAQSAQSWADTLAKSRKFQHSKEAMAGKFGENIAMVPISHRFAKDTVDYWYSEIKDYKYQKPGFSPETGHFSQVVWKATKEIGMAWATDPSDRRYAIVVAHYTPAGNVQNYFQNNVLQKRN